MNLWAIRTRQAETAPPLALFGVVVGSGADCLTYDGDQIEGLLEALRKEGVAYRAESLVDPRVNGVPLLENQQFYTPPGANHGA